MSTPLTDVNVAGIALTGSVLNPGVWFWPILPPLLGRPWLRVYNEGQQD
jgi:hypothetical protein